MFPYNKLLPYFSSRSGIELTKLGIKYDIFEDNILSRTYMGTAAQYYSDFIKTVPVLPPLTNKKKDNMQDSSDVSTS